MTPATYGKPQGTLGCGRVKFKRTVRIVRRRAADPAAFPP